MRRHLSSICCFLLFALTTSVAHAQKWDPFPDLVSGAQVAVKPSIDGAAWDPLRSCLPLHGDRSGARFYAGVVEVSDPGGDPSPAFSNAIAYAEALAGAWESHLGSRHILLVVSMKNRGVAILSDRYWMERGWDQQAMIDAIESSGFARIANSGTMAEAICALAGHIDQILRSYDQASTLPPPSQASSDSQPASFSSSQKDDGGLLSWIFELGILALLIAIPFFLRRRTGRARARAEEELEKWRTSLATASERLLELETEHPRYFDPEAPRFVASSSALDQRCADAVNHVFLLYSQAYQLRDRAERAAASGSAWSPKAWEEAWDLLRHTPVKFSTGEAEDRRRIFLPLTREYEGTALTLLEDLDKGYGEAVEALAEVDEAIGRVDEASLRAAEAATEALNACKERGELELPTAEALEKIEPLLQKRRHLDDLKAADPLGSTPEYDELTVSLGAVSERLRAGHEMVRELRGPVSERGRALRDELEQLRAGDWDVDEPGWDPDGILDQALRRAWEAEAQVAEGREDEARTQFDEALSVLGLLENELRRARDVRSEHGPRLDAVIAQRSALLEEIPGAREVLQRLHEQYALDGFREESDNLDQLQELVGRLDRRIEQVRAAVERKYFRTVVLALDASLELLAEGRDYLAELARIEEALAATRERVRALLEEAGKKSASALALLEEPGLGEEMPAEARRLQADLDGLVAAAGEATPDWPTLEPRAARVDDALEDLGKNLEVALSAWKDALAARDRLTAEVDELRAKVDRETRERLTVTRAVESVSDELAAWRSRFADPKSDGVEMLEEAHRVSSRLSWAQRLWREEIDLIQRVETEMRSTEIRLTQEDGKRLGYGVTVRCDAARRALDQARRAAERREWEEAAKLVQTAREEIEREVRRSRREERRIEERRQAEARRRERERRRRMAAEAVRVGLSVASSASSAGGAGMRRSSAPTRIRSVGRSGGGAFRGSRSGGSSW